MCVLNNPQHIQVFNGMALGNITISLNFLPITKLIRCLEQFTWIVECQTTSKTIKDWYIITPILISANWKLEFHVTLILFNQLYLLFQPKVSQYNLISLESMPLDYITSLSAVIQPPNVKLWLWHLLCTILDIFYQAITLFFMFITWL